LVAELLKVVTGGMVDGVEVWGEIGLAAMVNDELLP
jgi:hypothetical protein